MNVLLTKTTDGKKIAPKKTFSQWKDDLKNQINLTLTNHMRNYGYVNLNDFYASGIPQIHWNNKEYLNVNNFFADLNTWTIDQFIKNQLWKTNFGKIIFNRRVFHNLNNQIQGEDILTPNLVNELNYIINLTIKPGEILTNSEGNSNFKFFKYEDWKIDNSFFKVRYDGEWNQFFINLLSELGIKQSDIKNGISGKQLYYSQIVSQGLKRISANFNNLFKVSDYLYQFDLFFNDESISFEINLVCQDKNSNNPNMIIPLIFEEQSTGFQYFFNLYFGLLIGQNDKLKSGDVVLMDEPGSNLHVQGIIELRSILKQFTQATGISIILSTHSPFLVDFNYLDEIRLIDRIGGVVDINNNFQFNKEGTSNSLKAITNALATYPNSLIQYDDPIFIMVEGITDYNYLTGYKVYKINQLKQELTNTANDKKEVWLKLLHQYETLIFMPFNGLGKNENDFNHVFKSINDEYHQRKYKFLIDGDDKGEEFKNKFAKQTINLTDLIKEFNNVELKNRTIEKLISDEDKQNFGLMIGNKIEKHSNNSATFKYAMIKGKASEQTYQNFAVLFNNLLAKLNNK